MDYQEQKLLFEQLVTSKIIQTEFGMIELPVNGLQEFHNRIGLNEEQLCFFSLRLPECEDGIYNYVVGPFLEEDVRFEICEAFFYNDDDEDDELISCGPLLEKAFHDRLRSGEAVCCGDIMVDNLGRAWIAFMISDDIGVRTIATFKPKTLGLPIALEDNTKPARIWFNGESFCYSPTSFFFTGGKYLPS